MRCRNWGETVDDVAGAGEYHWMAGNFLKKGAGFPAPVVMLGQKPINLPAAG